VAESRGGVPAPLLAFGVDELFDEFASEARVPAGGSGAALVTGLAAAIVAKVARLSRSGWAEAGGAAAQANALRARAVELARADAAVYQDALAVLEGNEALDPAERDAAMGEALARAADVPLMIVATACDVALLARDVSEAATSGAGGDAAVAALLAEGAARSAQHLIEVNLATAHEDPRLARGGELVGRASAAAKRACTASA
jgi:formiminotetrahydrofolate cyclodeaminase